MSEQELRQYISDLQARRRALVMQLTDVDAQSATSSYGGGSDSYTNRTVADVKAKIAFCDREIASAKAALGLGAAPGSFKPLYAEFNQP